MPFLWDNFVMNEQKQWLFHSLTAKTVTSPQNAVGFRSRCDKNLICLVLTMFYNLVREVRVCMWMCVWERQRGKRENLTFTVKVLSTDCWPCSGMHLLNWEQIQWLGSTGQQEPRRKTRWTEANLALWLIFPAVFSLVQLGSWIMIMHVFNPLNLRLIQLILRRTVWFSNN